jgi:hypothetical protein
MLREFVDNILAVTKESVSLSLSLFLTHSEIFLFLASHLSGFNLNGGCFQNCKLNGGIEDTFDMEE